MPLTTINVHKRRRIPFTVRNDAGDIDMTTDCSAGSGNSGHVLAEIDPTDKRKLLVSILGYPGNFNVLVSVTSPFGDTATYEVFVPAPPDTSSIVFGDPEAEEDIPG